MFNLKYVNINIKKEFFNSQTKNYVNELIIYKSQNELGENGVSWFIQDNAVENYGFKLESSCKIGSDLKEIYKKNGKE